MSVNKLDKRSDKFSIVLNDNELHLFKSCDYIRVKLMCCEDLSPIYIACILHDKDIDNETKHVKTPHYHLVLMVNGRCRVQTMINKLVDLFHCNDNQISIDVCNSLEGQTRYLIHKDDFDKWQYDENDIVSNNKDFVNKCFELIEIADKYDCVNVVRKFHYNLETIMLKVRNYDKFRKYILDLVRFYR